MYPLSTYMSHVSHYYDVLEKRESLRESSSSSLMIKRRVYVATDDMEVLREARQRRHYNNDGHEYEITTDEKLVKQARTLYRASFESVEAALIDVVRLASCDYLVCTFSSNLCRLAYELMQSRLAGTDASWRFASLDDGYYFDQLRSSSHVVRFYLHYTNFQRQNKQSIDFFRRLDSIISTRWQTRSK